ncbi:MAG TPA: glycosyltransferase family 2 protein, partial [Oligoflexia bacterium]|nr:glycosyltransferase family 2 protein [Oligoflexia bacterium]
MKNDDVFFSLVILCYRAEESILPFVKRVHSIMSLYNFNWEIVLVANYLPNSTDKTPSIVKKLSDEYPHIRCVSEEKQGMMGWDLRKGLHSTRGQYIAMIDGDGQFPVESIFACFARMLMDDVDLVKTFRVFRYDGFYRTVISRGYNLIFRILFGKHFKDV